MPSLQLAGCELISGYRLTHRISAGGTSEVWAAEAPGDLPKAIKIVRNRAGWRRADEEFAALERMQRVRHPFLLSLERIEWVGQQLLIVTELADESLQSCQERARRQGRRGQPRRQLLDRLRDAAEALDFLADAHGLQHLDVKPENLLLLAGRAKLGDFGLVRSFQAPEPAHPAGLTPLYAAPELFAGAPHRHSDQYSLAIVFQQLLTGRLPFRGESLRELARQHWHAAPDLSDLSPGDRDVVARALSKDPARRFPSCRDLVAALDRSAMIDQADFVLDSHAESQAGDTALQCATEPLPTPGDRGHPGKLRPAAL